MRNKFGILAVVTIMLCFGVQAHAASAGSANTTLEGFSINLPSDWEVLNRQEMDELESPPSGYKMVLAATAKAEYPKIMGYVQDQGNLTQAEFEALPNKEIERMCGEFLTNIKSRIPTATNASCNRQKVAKGFALVVTMDLPEAKVRNSTWSFYRGPQMTTLISSRCALGDSAQIKLTDKALKSITLSDK